ncbi:MAG TPA: hypothetical protein PK395_16515 [bacterium]|nr:hypothetical protein [bacterium]
MHNIPTLKSVFYFTAILYFIAGTFHVLAEDAVPDDIKRIQDLLVERNWHSPRTMMMGEDNTLVIHPAEKLPESDLSSFYRDVLPQVPDVFARRPPFRIFERKIAGITLVRSMRHIGSGSDTIQHFRTVIHCPDRACAVFDEAVPSASGAYVSGPVWHFKAEAEKIQNATGITVGIKVVDFAMFTVGRDDLMQPEVVRDTDLKPREAKSHVLFPDVQDMNPGESYQSACVFLPIQRAGNFQAQPLRMENRLTGFAFLDGENALFFGSGHEGEATDYGPIRTDAACFFAGTVNQTVYIHFLQAKAISMISDAMVREIRLDGSVLPLDAWKMNNGRVEISWGSPRSGVLAIVTVAPFVPGK